jgi:hypothetical protein
MLKGEVAVNRLFPWRHLFSLIILFSLGAEARYYRCNINYPDRFDLFISTDANRVTRTEAFGGAYLKIKKSRRVTLSGETREVLFLEDGTDIQISLTDSTKNTDTGFYYPYTITYGKARGGCESEDAGDQVYVARVKSLVNSLGEVVVGGWPGEFGDYMGFKVTKDVTLPGGTTWKKLSAFERDSRACSLKKGARYLPARKRQGESYVQLTQPEKFIALKGSGLREDDFDYSRGDQVISLAPESEGFCLVEKKGVRYDIACIKSKGKEFKRVDTMIELPASIDRASALPPVGQYVLARCAEGHFTWISEKMMKLQGTTFAPASLRPK